MAVEPLAREDAEILAYKVALLRHAANHARRTWPGRLGETCAEWLIGEANCHEGTVEAGNHLGRLIDSVASSKSGGATTEVPMQMRVLVSTLDAAVDFARALLDHAEVNR